MAILSPICPMEAPYMGRNGHTLSGQFLAVVICGFRALPPLGSGQHPLFSLVFIHPWPKEGPGLETFAGTIFFMDGIGLNSASTCCGGYVRVGGSIKFVKVFPPFLIIPCKLFTISMTDFSLLQGFPLNSNRWDPVFIKLFPLFPVCICSVCQKPTFENRLDFKWPHMTPCSSCEEQLICS